MILPTARVHYRWNTDLVFEIELEDVGASTVTSRFMRAEAVLPRRVRHKRRFGQVRQ